MKKNSGRVSLNKNNSCFSINKFTKNEIGINISVYSHNDFKEFYKSTSTLLNILNININITPSYIMFCIVLSFLILYGINDYSYGCIRINSDVVYNNENINQNFPHEKSDDAWNILRDLRIKNTNRIVQ